MAVPAVSLFGLQLFAALFKVSGAGSFISPLSAWIALTLALNGAGPMSSTHRELFAVLVQKQVQLPASALLPATLAAEAAFNAAASGLMKGLNAQSSANGTELVVANAVWTKDTPIRLPYASDMARLFAAPVKAVTNTAPINKWASDVTRGLITQAVPADLKFSAVLTNAIYFKGAWQYAFSKSAKAAFTTPSKARATVDMMMKTFRPYEGADTPGARPVQYAEADGLFRAVKLPYKGGNISAIAVLPDEERFGLNADAALTGIGFDKLLEPKAWSALDDDLPVSLPKFSVKVESLSLSQALGAMGVKAAFDARAANFSRMSEEPLMVSDVLQSVQVIVDEAGTTAAAVTSVVMVATSLRMNAPEPLVFDRPFIFALVDETSQALLFMGTVKDPSKQ